MNVLSAVLLIIAGLSLIAAGVTRIGIWRTEANHPPAGTHTTVNDTRIHFVHARARGDADLPPIVFVHGASGNLRDQMIPLAPLLRHRADLLFVDRPGHGWSERGPASNNTPAGQADTLAALMQDLDIDKAIIAGHSFGGSIAAAFGVRHPEKTAGLLFLAPATHPWPGGDTSWYYRLANMPFLGRAFSQTLAWPGGTVRLKAAVRCVFAPNRVPDNYATDAAVSLVLRPENFRANAEDVEGLYSYVSMNAVDYKSIGAPTIVISGTRDTVVYEEIHSVGLARDIPGAELVWIKNLGHKPDWIARDVIVEALAKLAGKPNQMKTAVAELEKEIAADAFGPIERCPDEKPDYAKAAAE